MAGGKFPTADAIARILVNSARETGELEALRNHDRAVLDGAKCLRCQFAAEAVLGAVYPGLTWDVYAALVGIRIGFFYPWTDVAVQMNRPVIDRLVRLALASA